ncbi:hypothetical protein C8F04DRAFT_1271359 [Mycena alexandri]|uniref:Uncharacterized protein n=1 Tax=Mycena alexandri TaxID=1745969 RepID=A0AAD6S9K9_9AGAR|nr:hypothetical protein C8F04DRAFT_1271359 [Mycena alexandri]
MPSAPKQSTNHWHHRGRRIHPTNSPTLSLPSPSPPSSINVSHVNGPSTSPSPPPFPLTPSSKHATTEPRSTCRKSRIWCRKLPSLQRRRKPHTRPSAHPTRIPSPYPFHTIHVPSHRRRRPPRSPSLLPLYLLPVHLTRRLRNPRPRGAGARARYDRLVIPERQCSAARGAVQSSFTQGRSRECGGGLLLRLVVPAVCAPGIVSSRVAPHAWPAFAPCRHIQLRVQLLESSAPRPLPSYPSYLRTHLTFVPILPSYPSYLCPTLSPYPSSRHPILSLIVPALVYTAAHTHALSSRGDTAPPAVCPNSAGCICACGCRGRVPRKSCLRADKAMLAGRVGARADSFLRMRQAHPHPHP